jgi:hypothetical protein
MNMLKRITAFALVFVLMLGMATTALAADPGKGKGNQKQIEKTHQVAVDKKAAKEHGFWAVFIGKITGKTQDEDKEEAEVEEEDDQDTDDESTVTPVEDAETPADEEAQRQEMAEAAKDLAELVKEHMAEVEKIMQSSNGNAWGKNAKAVAVVVGQPKQPGMVAKMVHMLKSLFHVKEVEVIPAPEDATEPAESLEAKVVEVKTETVVKSIVLEVSVNGETKQFEIEVTPEMGLDASKLVVGGELAVTIDQDGKLVICKNDTTPATGTDTTTPPATEPTTGTDTTTESGTTTETPADTTTETPGSVVTPVPIPDAGTEVTGSGTATAPAPTAETPTNATSATTATQPHGFIAWIIALFVK